VRKPDQEEEDKAMKNIFQEENNVCEGKDV
jgi:hypothetical protein